MTPPRGEKPPVVRHHARHTRPLVALHNPTRGAFRRSSRHPWVVGAGCGLFHTS
ncbi:hypothetical protein EI94DRAFT_1735168 [Lactarius quietus]|nr:hypothetical protein EI94DRAFT_1735168 [Lactarius quietus]